MTGDRALEDHTAHPAAGLKPRGIRAGRHDGADHLGAGPDRTARLQHPDEPDATPTASAHTSNCPGPGTGTDASTTSAGTEKNLAHDATARLTGAVDPQRHPHMYAALAHIPAPHHQEHFDYGLHLIVNGIRADTERP